MPVWPGTGGAALVGSGEALMRCGHGGGFSQANANGVRLCVQVRVSRYYCMSFNNSLLSRAWRD